MGPSSPLLLTHPGGYSPVCGWRQGTEVLRVSFNPEQLLPTPMPPPPPPRFLPRQLEKRELQSLDGLEASRRWPRGRQPHLPAVAGQLRDGRLPGPLSSPCSTHPLQTLRCSREGLRFLPDHCEHGLPHKGLQTLEAHSLFLLWLPQLPGHTAQGEPSLDCQPLGSIGLQGAIGGR